MIPLHLLYCFGFKFIHPFCASCLEKILQHLLESWFGRAEFSQLCWSVKLLISPSYVNEILAGYSKLVCRLFSLITLSMSCHSLLASSVSIERRAVNLMGIPLCVICCFSLATFNICSLCLIFIHLINMCLFPIKHIRSLDLLD